MFPVNYIMTFHFSTKDYISLLDNVFSEVLLQFDDIIGVCITYEQETFESLGGVLKRCKEIVNPFLELCRTTYQNIRFNTTYSINPDYTGVEIEEEFTEGLICVTRIYADDKTIIDIKIYLENSKHILQ